MNPSDVRTELKQKVKQLPETPGVYLMRNSEGEIIYVGKAVSLKARVSQYFQHNDRRQNRIEQMIASITDFSFIQVETELEALVLESNLIKQYRPRYNAALRGDENHPYLEVDPGSQYPCISITTDPERLQDERLYIGPFYKSMDIESALEFVNHYYGLRSCRNMKASAEPDGHPCIYHAMKLCLAPCRNQVSEQVYNQQLRKGLDFFIKPSWEDIRVDLKEKMNDASAALAFEEAARYKNRLGKLDELEARMDFRRKDDPENTDLFSIAVDEHRAVILLYLLRGRRLSGRDLFILSLDGQERTAGKVLDAFLNRFYKTSPYVPYRVLVTERLPHRAELEQALALRRGTKVTCTSPRTGESGRLVQLARENAQELLKQSQRKS